MQNHNHHKIIEEGSASKVLRKKMNARQSKLGFFVQPIAETSVPGPDVSTFVKRFPFVYQQRMNLFISKGKRESDLMFSYPAFAFALATGYGMEGDKAEILGLLHQGQSSKKLADLYGLPRWLRKLPPEAFIRHIPDFSYISDDFHRRMMAFVPTDPLIAAQWFTWVMKALEIEGESLALWLAAQPLFVANEIMPPNSMLAPILLYAGYSIHHLEGQSALLIDRQWQPKMKLETALRQMHSWFGLVNRDYFQALQNDRKEPGSRTRKQSGKKRPKSWEVWIGSSHCLGYYFVPLKNEKALAEEGKIMHHCVATYAGLARNGICAIYSVRDEHRNRVATLELRHQYNDPTKAQIVQIKAGSNAPPKPEIRTAAQTWLANSTNINLPVIKPRNTDFMQNRVSHWEAYWAVKPEGLRVTHQWHWDNPAFLENALTRLHGMVQSA